MNRHPRMRRPSPWTEVLDKATYAAAERRRRRTQAWLVAHPTTRIALRLTRGA